MTQSNNSQPTLLDQAQNFLLGSTASRSTAARRTNQPRDRSKEWTIVERGLQRDTAEEIRHQVLQNEAREIQQSAGVRPKPGWKRMEY